jgi:hypothetical protein
LSFVFAASAIAAKSGGCKQRAVNNESERKDGVAKELLRYYRLRALSHHIKVTLRKVRVWSVPLAIIIEASQREAAISRKEDGDDAQSQRTAATSPAM